MARTIGRVGEDEPPRGSTMTTMLYPLRRSPVRLMLPLSVVVVGRAVADGP
jgi:hypothetical protein